MFRLDTDSPSAFVDLKAKFEMPTKVKSSKRKHASAPSDSEEETERSRNVANTKRVRWGVDIEDGEEGQDTNETAVSDDEEQSEKVSGHSTERSLLTCRQGLFGGYMSIVSLFISLVTNAR